ncbi:BrxA/BrxB family bacilliredoxin [Flavobacteriaceae bacterium]|jgi:putative YphP/YqiW family bacilliredoxin|nr:BrxA/BrxB family bacilliredoxin [Flavobacteriaceae bacterium]MDB4063154.1 BrxA/BrxB family bacilliredoxin [Flavobacteriaceae bacterium]MDC1392189.1 BrxA/BrxB family bacilliredoxin [Flavobacteriaceae bacterium]|tara:strand:+ start:535 stop:945 length:411 start_codon:yes stop_codon:yes gene_type:complete
MYPAELVKPMREELTNIGFGELHTSEDVAIAIDQKGTTLVVVNSVCGCAAANARPGVNHSLQNEKTPDHLVTVFAGVDTEATNTARDLMVPFPPSSPSIALFKDGILVHMVERHHIEGRPAELISENLKAAFNDHC